ncbi:MAG: hypothetical protein ACI4L8_09390 [Candidatus Fimadaptatus sp.]
MQNTLERAAGFMYRHARPLDMARWRYHFEGGPREDVLTALAAYQNADGGFGHALEADCWNPHSSPIQTWYATEILREVGPVEPGHPLVSGIVRYLTGGDCFDGRIWANTIPTNDGYPCASWWRYGSGGSEKQDYNPTAALAGFLVAYGAGEGRELGRRLAREAVNAYLDGGLLDDMHTSACYLRLYEYCAFSGEGALFDAEALRAKLLKQIPHCLSPEAEWERGYVCRPSQFISGPDSPWLVCCPEAARTQQADGAWPIPWSWQEYPAEWAVSRMWWQGDVAIKNMLFLKRFAYPG